MTHPNDDLDLPIPDDPRVSFPPQISFEEAFRLCEEMLPWEMQRPGFNEERLARKCSKEFVM